MYSANHDHLALLRRYLEAYEQGDPAILDEVLAPRYYQINAGTREDTTAVQHAVAQLREDHVSLSATIDEAVVQDDKIFSRVTWHRTDVATGQRSTYTSLFWSVVANGKLSHGWGNHSARVALTAADGSGAATEVQHA